MTEKRFEPIADHNGFVEYIRDNAQKRIGLLTFDEFIDSANVLHEENTQLKSSNMEMEDYLARLEEKNEQLKQRNDRQAKQLDRLYNLIEQKDWRALNDILDDFKKCDEQLRREWGTYGDVE